MNLNTSFTTTTSPMTSPSTIDLHRSLPLVVPSYHQQQLKFQLTGLGINQSFEGTIMFKNWSLLEGSSWYRALRSDDDDDKRHQPHYQPLEQSKGSYVPPYSYREERRQTKNVKRAADVTGATYYVVAVVLVYGMSIVLLIASHIKRKHSKVGESLFIAWWNNKCSQIFTTFTSFADETLSVVVTQHLRLPCSAHKSAFNEISSLH